MKPPRLFKQLALAALLLAFHFNGFSQKAVFTPDAKKDSIWVEKSLTNANKLSSKWQKGKVIYSSDKSLKATQLFAATDTFTTSIQLMYHGKIIQPTLGYTDLSNFSLDRIYRLPDKQPSYLFILSSLEDHPNDEQNRILVEENPPKPHIVKKIDYVKKTTYVAVLLKLKKDSWVEKAVRPPVAPDEDNQASENVDATDSTLISSNQLASDTNSFGFTAEIRGGKFPKPFLKYDDPNHKLSFLNLYNKADDDDSNAKPPYLNVEAASYQYRDTSFVLLTDTSYYYPALNTLAKTVSRGIYKAGKYTIQAKAIEGYEEAYGGSVYPHLIKQYQIGTQTLTASNNEEWDKIDLKPNFRLQTDASVIILLSNDKNYYAPGMCGSGSYFDSEFWVTDGKSSRQLFSFSSSTCTTRVDYTYSQNNKEISGSFYLVKPTDQNDSDYEFGDSYWKDNSTYVFSVLNSEKGLARNFYLNFNPADITSPVKFTPGKLTKIKIRPSN